MTLSFRKSLNSQIDSVEKSMKEIILVLIAVTLIGLIGCEETGPAAKAGERVDEVIDNIKHGDAPLKEKGTLEKMGDSIDDVVKKSDKRE